MEERRGLVIVHTGNGKGKTTAALGLAIRAWGQGMNILILQFIKGSWQYGELKALEKFAPQLQIVPMGDGFVRNSTATEKLQHCQLAQTTLMKGRDAMLAGTWDMVILDEVNYAVKFGLITLNEVLELVEQKPASIHLVLTGRDAAPELIAKADLVTEMREIKHHYQQGISAQAGIEF